MQRLLCFVVMLCMAVSGWAKAYKRIVSVDGFITEIVSELGFGENIVGVGMTSKYPEDVVKKAKSVGYIRQLNAEGLLSLNPDLILLSDGVKPAVVVDQVKQAGVPIYLIPSQEVSTDKIFERIQTIGNILGVPDKAAKLVTVSKAQITALQRKFEGQTRPRALFFLGHGNGSPLVAGKGTNPDWILRHAGAENLATFTNWKNIDPESAMQLSPDVIFINGSQRGRPVDHAKLILEIKKMPAYVTSPAVKHSRVFVVDYAYTFSLGSRVASALWEVAFDLHPTLLKRPAQSAK